jgi:hypothetical protein
MIDEVVRHAFDDADTALPTGLLERVGAQLADEFDSVREPAHIVGTGAGARARVRVALGIGLVIVVGVVVFALTRNHSARPAVEVRPTSSTTTTATSGPDTASALADELLDRATLPPGARPSSAPLPPILALPATSPSATTLVDHHRQFAVPTAAPEVAAFLQDHPNPGTASDGIGSVTGAGNTIAYFVDEAVANITGDLIVSAEIEYSVTAANAATSVLRVDAIVIWGPRHPHIPARDVVVVATRELASDPHRRTRIVVTDAPTVAQLVAAFEKSKEDVAVRHCPLAIGNPDVYSLSFAASGTARPDVVVSIAATGCSDAEVQVDGHAAPVLTGGELLAGAQQLFTQG